MVSSRNSLATRYAQTPQLLGMALSAEGMAGILEMRFTCRSSPTSSASRMNPSGDVSKTNINSVIQCIYQNRWKVIRDRRLYSNFSCFPDLTCICLSVAFTCISPVSYTSTYPKPNLPSWPSWWHLAIFPKQVSFMYVLYWQMISKV